MKAHILTIITILLILFIPYLIGYCNIYLLNLDTSEKHIIALLYLLWLLGVLEITALILFLFIFIYLYTEINEAIKNAISA